MAVNPGAVSTAPTCYWLLIKHSGAAAHDRCMLWLERRGIPYRVVRPFCGEQLPDLDLVRRIVVYGGVDNVTARHRHHWMLRELRYIEAAIERGIPCTGICLGGQLIAHVLGASVGYRSDRQREIGFNWVYPCIEPKAASQGCGKSTISLHFLPKPQKMLQWHSQGFSLPPDCIHLARSQCFECQAFSYQHTHFALQFHPEVTPALLQHWHSRYQAEKSAWLTPYELVLQKVKARWYNRQIESWFYGFLQGWGNVD